MELYNKDIKRIIKVLETTVLHRKFPGPLRTYLIETYKFEDWPYDYDEGELRSWITEDAESYFIGNLNIKLEPPVIRAMDKIQATRELYGEAVREKLDLEAYIDELQELLWAHSLEGRLMLHDETGAYEGTYEEFNTLHPEKFEYQHSIQWIRRSDGRWRPLHFSPKWRCRILQKLSATFSKKYSQKTGFHVTLVRYMINWS